VFVRARVWVQVLFESIGVLCFALKFIAELPPPPGRVSIYKLAGVILLGTADHAIYAVNKGFPLLVEYLKQWRGDPLNKPNGRLAGLEFLLSECARLRPQGKIEHDQKEGIQLTSLHNIVRVMQPENETENENEDDSLAKLLTEAATTLVRNSSDMIAWACPSRLVNELLRRIVFCLANSQNLSITNIEETLSNFLGPARDSHPLKSVLRDLATAAAMKTHAESLVATDGGEESGWREVLELTLEAVGWYVFHSEVFQSFQSELDNQEGSLNKDNLATASEKKETEKERERGHSNAIVLLEELLSWRSEVGSTGMGGAQSVGWGRSGRWNEQDGREEGFAGLLLRILEHEQERMAAISGGPVSNALLAMTERIFHGFSYHAMQQANDSLERTHLGMALGKIENVWLQPDKLEHREWTRKCGCVYVVVCACFYRCVFEFCVFW